MTISQAQQTVQTTLDQATKDQNSGLHGVAFVAVDKNGDVLAQHASGTRTQGGNDPVTLETMFWIASCTKFIVTIAAMQLVERGKIGLDDAQALYKIVPELKTRKSSMLRKASSDLERATSHCESCWRIQQGSDTPSSMRGLVCMGRKLGGTFQSGRAM